jgi:hypothetical protein
VWQWAASLGEEEIPSLIGARIFFDPGGSMSQYQTEKIKMFEVAISTTSSISALIASDAPSNSAEIKEPVWTSKAIVKRALARTIS